MVTRRSFASLAALGAGAVLAAPSPPPSPLPAKPHLRTLSALPLNAETPAHLLDEPFTSAQHMFVRNNGLLPASTDPSGWELTIDGEACLAPRRFSLAELRGRFETHLRADHRVRRQRPGRVPSAGTGQPMDHRSGQTRATASPCKRSDRAGCGAGA